MFGNHDYKTAVKIAAEKQKELNKNTTVFPSEDEPGLYTIGIEIKAITGAEFKQRLLDRLGKK